MHALLKKCSTRIISIILNALYWIQVIRAELVQIKMNEVLTQTPGNAHTDVPTFRFTFPKQRRIQKYTSYLTAIF